MQKCAQKISTKIPARPIAGKDRRQFKEDDPEAIDYLSSIQRSYITEKRQNAAPDHKISVMGAGSILGEDDIIGRKVHSTQAKCHG